MGYFSAGAAVVGDVLSSQGQSSANRMNMGMQQQMEGWQQMMSDTSMQRRVADLKAANLNPMLAVGQGGASTPGFSPVTVQNPMAAMGQLGGQVSSAVQSAASTKSVSNQAALVPSQVSANLSSAGQADAVANKANVDAAKAAGVDTDAVRQMMAESQTRQLLMGAQAEKATADAQLDRGQLQVAEAQLPKISAEIQAIGASRTLDEANTHVAKIAALQGQLNLNQFKSISPELITQARIASAQARLKFNVDALGMPEAQQTSEMWTANPGLSRVNAVMNWFHLGANISH